MPNTTIRKADGTSGGDVVLSPSIFGAKINMGLMHQAVLSEMINRRQDTRDTKTRGEVAGGGRKPYRQKGTGRARQGTISAPHYRHGGIVFGPHPRDLSAQMPKKARRAAIFSALSSKVADDAVIVLDNLTMDTHSTKTAVALLKALGVTGKTLLVLPDVNLTIYKSFRNIPGVEIRVAPQFSTKDVLDAERIVIVQGALEKIDAVWGKVDRPEPKTQAVNLGVDDLPDDPRFDESADPVAKPIDAPPLPTDAEFEADNTVPIKPIYLEDEV